MMRILPATADQLERIAPLYQKGARISSLDEARRTLADALDQKKAPGAQLSGQKWHLLVGESLPGRVDGLLVTGPPRDPSLAGAQLHVLAVSKDGFGRRLARALVDETKIYLRAAGIESLWIDSDERNLRPFVEAGACVLCRLPPRDGKARRRARLFVMKRPEELKTERLLLRNWLPSDLPRLYEMGQDPRVNAHLPGPFSKEQCTEMAARATEALETHGFGFWAAQPIERTSTDPEAFLGFVGLAPVVDVPQITARVGGPTLEIGWRLFPRVWGQGLATEAAQACLQHAFGTLHVDEVVSFTVPENLASQRVMTKIGLVRDSGGDFDHPRLEPGHRLRRHVLFRRKNPSKL